MSHPLLITDAHAARGFMFGGSARFTLVSKKTGDRKTYRMKKSKGVEPVYFAQLLTGPDNTADYTYLGFAKYGQSGLIPGRKGNPAHPAYLALNWTMNRLAQGEMPEMLEFWHEGRCSACGRVLTDPVSIERGFGPECAAKFAQLLGGPDGKI